MKVTTVKTAIQKKFGSISRFAKLSGMDRYKLQILFSVKHPDEKKLREVMQVCRQTENLSLPGEMSDQLIELISSRIAQKGGPYKFCKDNPEFSCRWIRKIVNGQAKRSSKVIDALMDKLGL